MKHAPMRRILTLAILFSLLTLQINDVHAATNRYKVAHVKYQGKNMVVVWVNHSFFNGSDADQSRWFTAIQQCVRTVNLAGQTLLVTEGGGRFRFYGPNNWHTFLRTIDMPWVRARLNKELTCNF